MARRKAKDNQNSIVKKTPKAATVTKAQAPTDEVKLNDVEVPTAPVTGVAAMVQEAVDGGANAADVATQAFAQSYTDRLTQNMPVAFAQMGNVTSTVFGAVTQVFEEAADIESVQIEPTATAVYLEGAEDERGGQA